MSKLPQPLNGNVIVSPRPDQVVQIFKDPDSKKDLQYAEVLVTSKPWVMNEEMVTTNLTVGDIIIYNPRTLNKLAVEGEGLLGIVHEGNIIAIL